MLIYAEEAGRPASPLASSDDARSMNKYEQTVRRSHPLLGGKYKTVRTGRRLSVQVTRRINLS